MKSGIESGGEGPRLISPERGAELFAFQTTLYPELQDEINALSSGKPGIITAIIVRMGEAISLDPVPETTPQRMREVLGAPEDVSKLEDWRRGFWESFQESQTAE